MWRQCIDGSSKVSLLKIDVDIGRERERDRRKTVSAHLEHLNLLQDQFFSLQVVFGQNNHLLNRPPVCGPGKHLRVNITTHTYCGLTLPCLCKCSSSLFIPSCFTLQYSSPLSDSSLSVFTFVLPYMNIISFTCLVLHVNWHNVLLFLPAPRSTGARR